MKPNHEVIKKKIHLKIEEIDRLIPSTWEPDLPPNKIFPDTPEWHSYEHEIWNLGEEIRLLLKDCPKLQNDNELYQLLLSICLNRNCKRGRQSFFCLFAHKRFSRFALQIATQADDIFVTGHVLSCLQKMKIAGYNNLMEKYISHPQPWVRNIARKYVAQHAEEFHSI